MMAYYMKILILEFRYKFLHRAIIHCYDLVAIHADSIMFMLETIKFIHGHFIIHNVGLITTPFFTNSSSIR